MRAAPPIRSGWSRPTSTTAAGSSIDVIQAVDGRPVRSQADLFDALDGRKLGEEVTLRVRRGSQVADVPVRLQPIQ